ncbi:MAG: hypothetical protein HOV80_30885 [Polyangiaceae bacterium]|nr:hypothetical protein [Polyangiaceae bacterium]
MQTDLVPRFCLGSFAPVLTCMLTLGCGASAPPAIATPSAPTIAEATFDVSPGSAAGMPTTSTLVAALHDVPPPGFGPKDVSSTVKGSRFAIAVQGRTEYEAMDRCLAISRAVVSPLTAADADLARDEWAARRDALFDQLDKLERSLVEISVQEATAGRSVAEALIAARLDVAMLERIDKQSAALDETAPPMLRLAFERKTKAWAAVKSLSTELGPNNPDMVAMKAMHDVAATAFAAQLGEEKRWALKRLAALELAPKKGTERDAQLATQRLLADDLERPDAPTDGFVPSAYPVRLRVMAREIELFKTELARLKANGLGSSHPDRLVLLARLDREQRRFDEERKTTAKLVREFSNRGIVLPGVDADDRPAERARAERELSAILQRLRQIDRDERARRPAAKIEIACHINAGPRSQAR